LLRFHPLLARLLGGVACGCILSSLTVAHAAAGAPPLLGICSESDRFGVAVAGWIGGYDVAQLHTGWYHNFALSGSPLHPDGMRYVQTIRVSDDGPFVDRACSTCPPWQTLAGIIQANPSSLWLVGNEPDRQDYVYSDHYAQLYHDFYSFLKAEDPTCQVGVGGVVQTTPLRLQYLDLILAAYQTQYGQAMPVDVWNVHHYLLREATDWGGGVPPGTDTTAAILYGIQEHDQLEPNPEDPAKVGWKMHLVQMRQWMRDRGYRDRPLIITEYGILMPEIYGFDYERVKAFMLNTFAWMLAATDPDIGYPADGNRLIQAWAWYSLNDPAFEGFTSWNHLFYPDSKAITALGLDFATYTAPLTDPFPGTIDLRPAALWHTDPQPGGSSPVAMTVLARIANDGAETAHDVQVHFERDGLAAGDVTLASIEAGKSKVATITWQNLVRGSQHQVTVTASAAEQAQECDPYNNRLAAPLLVTDIGHYLSIVLRDLKP
jgi:hypothetical protein